MSKRPICVLWKAGNKNNHKILEEGREEGESMYLQSKMFLVDMEFNCENEMGM